MEDKSKNSKVLVIVLIAVIAILAAVGITRGVLLMNNNSSQTQDTAKQQGVVFDSDASHYEQEVSNAGGAEQGIKIPGYPDMTISSESTDFPITLLNPEENPCNFKFTLSLQETGETLCTTDLVKPGDAIKGVTLDKPIEKGTYTLIINISTYSVITIPPVLLSISLGTLTSKYTVPEFLNTASFLVISKLYCT